MEAVRLDAVFIDPCPTLHSLSNTGNQTRPEISLLAVMKSLRASTNPQEKGTDVNCPSISVLNHTDQRVMYLLPSLYITKKYWLQISIIWNQNITFLHYSLCAGLDQLTESHTPQEYRSLWNYPHFHTSAKESILKRKYRQVGFSSKSMQQTKVDT